jgi:two-component system, cell cycle response regulator
VSSTDGAPSPALLVTALVALVVLGFAFRADGQALAAWQDTLPGVASRRRLDHDLALGIEGEFGPTAAIVVGIDRLAEIAADFGNEIADLVLCDVSSVLSANVRAQDVLYRYGDAEFCVLLAGAGADDAQAIADRVLDAVRTVALPDGTHATVSVGVAEGDNESLAETVAAADRAAFDVAELELV